MSVTGESLTLEQGKGELEATKACPHSLFEDFEKSGKPGKNAVSKKSCRILRSAGNVVEHSGTKDKPATVEAVKIVYGHHNHEGYPTGDPSKRAFSPILSEKLGGLSTPLFSDF
ncbi:unnamed protein product [Eruca vesicaria subsp. sativa]|uniref:Uncharacterized protein n=1 Tax=Eruca vesicaria subsp. sativa TaxID=29727 RepID=A0ABC8M7Q3_ERUVS|nr:unnamed protein product [Eruca vesicaria subsp. sativa]